MRRILRGLLRWALRALSALVAVVVLLAGVRAWLLWPQVDLQPVVPEAKLELPTDLVEVPDGSGRMVVLEKAGRLHHFRRDGAALDGLVMDLSDRVSIKGWEDGLLSIAFDPDFARNRQFYLFYSALEPRRSVLARYTMAPEALRADPASEEVLLTIPKQKPDHNGSEMVFGPDGYLYVGVGDGNIQPNGQDRRTLKGAILRIDVRRTGSDGQPYAIPPDNPFRNNPVARPEVWAYGVRNPWRFSYDAPTGRLYLADVGGRTQEEVSLIGRGTNLGWPVWEGDHCKTLRAVCDGDKYTPPIASFDRWLMRSIIGGYVYRGEGVPAMQGRYVFGDLFRGLYAIPAEPAGIVKLPDVLAYRPRSPHPGQTDQEMQITTLARDTEGELYVATISQGLYRIVPLGSLERRTVCYPFPFGPC